MLKLHFAPNSRAGRIVWLLEELSLPYEVNKMAFHPEALKSDEHRQRHRHRNARGDPHHRRRRTPPRHHLCQGLLRPLRLRVRQRYRPGD